MAPDPKHVLIAVLLLMTAAAAMVFDLSERRPGNASNPLDLAACPAGLRDAYAPAIPSDRDLKDRVAGLMVTGFVGDSVSHDGFAEFVDFLASHPIAGVIYLKRNVGRAADVVALNETLAEVMDRPFIMVDEEGGIVSRLGDLPGFPSVPAARDIARSTTPEGAFKLYGELAEALAGLGFNVNLGPVVDLSRNPANPVIAGYRRAYSAEPSEVVAFARAFSVAHAEAGIVTALKHFPGHGSSVTDTHVQAADVSRTWHADELIPFARLIGEERAPMVMTSHVTLASPVLGLAAPEVATFSAGILGYIRETLCHQGLVISDDMTMSAVAEDHSLADRLEKAIRAGHDLVIIAAPRWIGTGRIGRAIATVAARAEADPDLAATVDAAYARVAAFKRRHLPPGLRAE